jgi:fructokinase
MIDFSRTPGIPGFPVVASIGEALFDCFLDRSILGGAPVNLIVHLQQLLAASDGQGVLVSRVGEDELGNQLIEQLGSRGIPTNLIQVDPRRPTGQVQVEVSSLAETQFEIAEDVAWDYISYDDSLELLAASCSAVCFGTLAQRSAMSRATIQRFLAAATHAIRMLDVNLRQNYVTPQILESSFAAANVVKLNERELAVVSSMLPLHFGETDNVDDRAQALIQAFDLKVLALTRGAKGTVLYTEDDRLEGDPVRLPFATRADDVGAGDACCAGLVYGLLMQWPVDRTLQLANQLGAFVASQPGGTPRLPPSLINFATAERV